ncbi:hypothetical protein QBC47DRAFT_371359 [Echria macrotheca]|uniref:Uncharacterized protein n=1 Tax=Echria macrotheca TaxID=438768 RepID=A0AAJ0FDD8_9PEZI|nr:hypothetical protein QBC47DRAFT_371359 [Echria macrotheca]
MNRGGVQRWCRTRDWISLGFSHSHSAHSQNRLLDLFQHCGTPPSPGFLLPPRFCCRLLKLDRYLASWLLGALVSRPKGSRSSWAVVSRSPHHVARGRDAHRQYGLAVGMGRDTRRRWNAAPDWTWSFIGSRRRCCIPAHVEAQQHQTRRHRGGQSPGSVQLRHRKEIDGDARCWKSEVGGHLALGAEVKDDQTLLEACGPPTTHCAMRRTRGIVERCRDMALTAASQPESPVDRRKPTVPKRSTLHGDATLARVHYPSWHA